ncbi:FecR family protein [Mucilaginibacter paludis]|uniref:Anti-FecI sigma factor, FecR n=1 Tax=Mucilaginibacter paludis DSM 18603 TaxID=714943 RepID=H1Y4F1_9SPHI|nr:FecR domain-containing protein [Mucilaginibacter paludis]EHQ25785.1 anti-FecI sigma factor, FecR [Mucilaginibacter paludis DSM 18603]
MEEKDVVNLIRKHLDGTATKFEEEKLDSWYNQTNEQGLLWPYQDEAEEEDAKKRIFEAIQSKYKQVNTPVKRLIAPLMYKLAAASILLIGIFYGIAQLWKYQKPSNAGEMVTVVTKRGEHKKILLADGSLIWLSSESHLTFRKLFKAATRDIEFEGEAFFDIAKDKAHPFIVHTGTTTTRVLGTSFNITAYKANRHITLSLLTGKVAFSTAGAQKFVVPGQMIIYDKASWLMTVKKLPDTQLITARRDGLYEYRNVRVEDVVNDVSRNFNAHIQLAGSVKNRLFYGRVKPGETVEQFLQKLAKVVDARLIKVDDGFILTEGGVHD